MTQANKAPWHLWLVVAFGVLWNGFGAYDYVMSMTRDEAYLSQYPPEIIELLDNMPVWANALWALGVWGSVAGTILLAMRSRHAATAFIVSLVSAAINFVHGLTQDIPEALQGAMMTIMPIVIVTIIALQWWYARRQTVAGVLE